METKTRAIVLRSVRYGDSQIIVDVFSREKGRASFICHVSKNGRGKIKQQLFANFHLVFMLRLSRFIGFFPNLEEMAEGDWFDLRNGVFTSIRPLHPDFLRPDEAAKIGTLMRMNYDNMRFFRMSSAERNECVDTILTYYRLHIPGFPEMKSLPVLRELF